MTKLSLSAALRDAGSVAKKVRKNGQLPGVLYGRHTKPVSVAVAQNEFEKVLRKAGESTIIELAVNGNEIHNVLIHDLQRHPVTHTLIHADFLEVSMTEKLTATVRLEFVGEALAVKAHSGTLVKQLTEIEVECLPGDLPNMIEVNIESLATFEDSITIADLDIPKGVEVKNDADEVVAKVQPPRDVEADLAQEIGDVASVEGIKEDPATEGEAPAEETKE